MPVPHPSSISDLSSTSSEQNLQRQESTEVYEPILNQPQKFTQGELNDLVRDLNLSKESAQLLRSRLHAKHLLAPNTYFAWYGKREEEFVPFFSQEESLVSCQNIPDLIEKLGAKYNSGEWRLFIDSSKWSQKGVLLHNTNQYASVPVAHSVHLKETYENLETMKSS
ncbi:GSCOCG00011430001-RA-CDS [Cotesia congregata]|nr:GSCOCG00011430001-RA-CDS [Cotesia congregata]